MPNNLGEYIRARREQLGLRRSEVARRLGYENVSKGSARLHRVEEGRWASRDFLLRLMAVLQIDPRVVEDLITRDQEEYVAEWNRQADQPTPMHAAIRLIPGFIAGIDLPANVTTQEEALAWAIQTAKLRQKKVFVVVSRRLSYTVHEDGRVDDIHAKPGSNGLPWVALGSMRFLPNLGSNATEERSDTP